jgi:hypothetical protein
MSQAEYDKAADTLTVRELRTGGKILMTTLLCSKRTSKAALKAIYRDRWHVELDLRNIKTTLGMEIWSCRTPVMAEKEIWVGRHQPSATQLQTYSAAMDCLAAE